ncbi:dihydrofolate reductase-like [Ostrea edulis]|uniref:dihydrofolate reductase-like n=1 Tax=Ostrea edulis TaxID=37623 RepID=UPI00209629C4|nr:dihydrofolate reductase-like [Ostrea edulis]
MGDPPGFSVMAAMCRGRGIGYKNKLSWWQYPLKGDYDYYMDWTSRVTSPDKYCVNIMGRKTWETTGEEERNRKHVFNIVISRDTGKTLKKDPHVHKIISSFDDAVRFSLSTENREQFESVWILGGEKVYEEAVQHPLCRRIFLTEIMEHFQSDTFFPQFEEEKFEKTSESDVHEENGIRYVFKVYSRKSE